ncbi:MAG: hypothetical protein Fues2KO_14790 [Fuerstiella sp.]
MHPTPLVSIVIPVFNRPDLLHIVLDGLASQTTDPSEMEILVCDDGSTEDLSEVVQLFETRLPGLALLRQPNQGPAAARNLGIRNASSDVVLFLDSDVIPGPKLVDSLLRALQENADWVGAEAQVIPTEGEDNNLWDAPVCKDGGVYLTAAIAYRRAALVHAGGFDESFKRAACEDVELAARMLPQGTIGFVRDAVIEHPRRKKTLAMYWKKRNDWRFVLYLAQRHGFIGWPGNITRSPRLRLLWCALVTQPAGRLLQSLRLTARQPTSGLTCTLHAVFSWFCGLAAVPDLLTAQIPPARNYVELSEAGSSQKRAA